MATRELTTAELAADIGVPPQTLRDWVLRGMIPGVCLPGLRGRHSRWSLGDAEFVRRFAWLISKRVITPAAARDLMAVYASDSRAANRKYAVIWANGAILCGSLKCLAEPMRRHNVTAIIPPKR